MSASGRVTNIQAHLPIDQSSSDFNLAGMAAMKFVIMSHAARNTGQNATFVLSFLRHKTGQTGHTP